jgi:acetyl esterase/lipase
MKTKSFFLMVVLGILFSCTKENDSTQMEALAAKTLLNSSYGINSQQKFDLYLPANRSESKTKTLILVHGGGWTEGDKANMDYAVDIIKINLPEYAIANINYRLATATISAFPMQIEDLQAVVTKLKNENYGISDDFGFIGVSAGAHLSMLYSYGYDASIKMVCSIVGPTNFTDTNYTSNPFMVNLFQMATGVSYASNPTFYQQISPIYKVTAASQPTIMLYGNTDPLIPTTQCTAMVNKLNEFGIYNEFKIFNGGHGDWIPADQVDAYNRLVNFIKNKF